MRLRRHTVKLHAQMVTNYSRLRGIHLSPLFVTYILMEKAGLIQNGGGARMRSASHILRSGLS